jgi:hypothetical protein
LRQKSNATGVDRQIGVVNETHSMQPISTNFFAALAACLAGCYSGGDSNGTVDIATASTVADAPTALVATAASTPYIRLTRVRLQARAMGRQYLCYLPTKCTMTIISNGQPNHAIHTYYLEPVNIRASVATPLN